MLLAVLGIVLLLSSALDDVDAAAAFAVSVDEGAPGAVGGDVGAAPAAGVSACVGRVQVRLVGGQSRYEGRLEVRRVGTFDAWGTVCDDSFDDRAADVVCRCLQYGAGRVLGSNIYPADLSKDIHVDDVSCSGHEEGLGNCRFNSWGVHDCSHFEDVAVSCQPRIFYHFRSPLASSSPPHSTPAVGSPSLYDITSTSGYEPSVDSASAPGPTPASGPALTVGSATTSGPMSTVSSAATSGSQSTLGSAASFDYLTTSRLISPSTSRSAVSAFTGETGVFHPLVHPEYTGNDITKQTDAVFASVGTALAVLVLLFVAVAAVVIWRRRSGRVLSPERETTDPRIGKLPTLFDDDGSDYDVIFEKAWKPPKMYYNIAFNTPSVSDIQKRPPFKTQPSTGQENHGYTSADLTTPPRTKHTANTAIPEKATRITSQPTTAVVISSPISAALANNTEYLNTKSASNTSKRVSYSNPNGITSRNVSHETKFARRCDNFEKDGGSSKGAVTSGGGTGDNHHELGNFGGAVTSPGAQTTVDVTNVKVTDETCGSVNCSGVYDELSETGINDC